MVVYTGNRVENNCPTHGDGFTQDDPQQIFDSGPQANLDAVKLKENDFGIYKRAFYEKIDALESNVTSSQTVLGTSLVRQFIEHQLQIASDLDFVKL
ncbi:hypothetical protein F511_32990 [Dorcoceras hygrometricum]|uniref:Uncharacterized protein n=1 Tax=Dorcoceras hygrometricum TaxID=472368 RepID=A0A2Z7B7P8_9LAMI|nr:hypothetical protein F511_32990 [Dorcoceras hygrometricum]